MKFISSSAALGSLSVAGERLLLHVEGESARLQAGELRLELSSWHGCELQLSWMRPAKGPGWCELALLDPAINRFSTRLFCGQFQNLDWMRGQAQSIAQALNIGLKEVDLGGDA